MCVARRCASSLTKSRRHSNDEPFPLPLQLFGQVDLVPRGVLRQTVQVRNAVADLDRRRRRGMEGQSSRCYTGAWSNGRSAATGGNHPRGWPRHHFDGVLSVVVRAAVRRLPKVPGARGVVQSLQFNLTRLGDAAGRIRKTQEGRR